MVRLPVEDLEFDPQAIIVRDGTGAQDRVTIVPDSRVSFLEDHLQRLKEPHERHTRPGATAQPVCLKPCCVYV